MPAAPRYVLLVDRGRKTRHVRNDDDAVAAIERALSAANRTDLKVLRWQPAAQLEEDILAWRQAALVVAPHGAGLANLIFAREGCPVLQRPARTSGWQHSALEPEPSPYAHGRAAYASRASATRIRIPRRTLNDPKK